MPTTKATEHQPQEPHTMTIEERIKNIVSIQLGASPDDIKLDSNFINDLGADSLDEIELCMAIEDEFEIEIPDEAAEKIKTVQQAVDYITAKSA